MGVEVETITAGDGSTFPKKGQTCVVHYVGSLTNGHTFDSSRDRGKPFKFKIGKQEVIRGWDDGVAQMSVGQRARLTCTPTLLMAAKATRASSSQRHARIRCGASWLGVTVLQIFSGFSLFILSGSNIFGGTWPPARDP